MNNLEVLKHRQNSFANTLNPIGDLSEIEKVLLLLLDIHVKELEAKEKIVSSLENTPMLLKCSNSFDWQAECKTITKQHDEALTQIKWLDNYVTELNEIIAKHKDQKKIIRDLKLKLAVAKQYYKDMGRVF